jgi:hypothetical protein
VVRVRKRGEKKRAGRPTPAPVGQEDPMMKFNEKFMFYFKRSCNALMFETKAKSFVSAWLRATQDMHRSELDEQEAWLCFEDTEAEICEDRDDDFVIVFLDSSRVRWSNIGRMFHVVE